MFIISEIFPQHSGDLTMAKRMILQSYLAGASAAKVQLVQDNMFSNDNIDRSENEISYEIFSDLFDYGKSIGIDVFATAFNDETLEWCLKLNTKYLKIAARTHKENPKLVKKILNLNKKTFISVRPDEVSKVEFVKNENFIYLSCISSYPTLLSDVTLPEFNKSPFSGISDHSLGIATALKSCSLGARFIEKHFSFDKNLQKHYEKGHLGSMDFSDLQLLKQLTLEIEEIGKKPKKLNEKVFSK
jgi:sialic acid synthase SpsE|tara:strand:- start:417 stop:1148 length:732 start_codon:yes stop_codon:yes gene_type:complete